MKSAIVIGAGPAGLMAAEALASAGVSVMVAEAKPSPARKFLMAGKSGLNLTKDEPFEEFVAHYAEGGAALRPMLAAFGPDDVKDWAEGLEQTLFTGTTGRVFPRVMKASPLLRNWLARLDGLGVSLRRRWRWTGWSTQGALVFETPDGPRSLSPDVTILACGGASWARLGADGAWTAHLCDAVRPFQASNVGVKVNWSAHMTRHFGHPLKAIALRAGAAQSRGEIVLSSRGIEGGGIYPLSPALRQQAPLTMDLLPDFSVEQVRDRLVRKQGKTSLSNHLRKALRLSPAKIALLMEMGRPLPQDLAPLVKALPVRHEGMRPLDEAISTSGGLLFDAMDTRLMLQDRPGTFAAGEMLDWDAPTGGYLLTACLATGQWAGRAAAAWVHDR